MEFYGKILCISKDDLTRDDRPTHGGVKVHGSLAPIMSVSCYDKLVTRGQINVARPGKGKGNYALIEVATIPQRFQSKIKSKYGELKPHYLRDWFGSHYELDDRARSYYTTFRFDNGKPLPPEHITEYTINASVLQAVVTVMQDSKIIRQSMQGGRIVWGEMAGAINFYQAEFKHTLPLSAARFQEKVELFRSQGYGSLISKKFRNQNTRKVNYDIERLLVSLAILPNRPWNTSVGEMYNQFVTGELQVFDPETGEIFNPEDFRDKKGNPLVLSQTTINNYLNKPKNQLLIDQHHMTWSTFMHEQRPHMHRHAPEFSFSKISFDDRDLPRKTKDEKIRPKAYYAYDVTSGCVVGFAYNRNKTVDLVVDMFRDMFRRIDRMGWNCPAQIEVENHLMSQWKNSFLKAGVLFPFVRFCAPLNSQEKRAEHFNGAKKISVEHGSQIGIGRFYAKRKKYRTEGRKVSDETNDLYEDKEYYTWDELIADDQQVIHEWNHSLHSNQKMYPGMTRWQVLEANMNPNLQPVDKAILYRFIGEHVETSIRRNSYCRVNYTNLWLSSPDIIDQLAPNNYKVDAYYLTDEEGNMGDVYIYQNGILLDKLTNIGTYNEAYAEQTDEDQEIYIQQTKYVSKFDKKMKDEKVPKVGILSPETAMLIQNTTAKAVEIPPEEEEDYTMFMDVSYIRQNARNSL